MVADERATGRVLCEDVPASFFDRRASLDARLESLKVGNIFAFHQRPNDSVVHPFRPFRQPAAPAGAHICGVQHCQNATSVPDDIPMDGVAVHALSVDRALFPSIGKLLLFNMLASS